MTLQQLFDKVATHLLTQKVPCYAEDNETPTLRNGKLSDSTGCLFPENFNFSLICGELSIDNDLLVEVLHEQGIIVGDNIEVNEQLALLAEFQEVHDRIIESDWQTAISDIAVKFNLVFNTKECAR